MQLVLRAVFQINMKAVLTNRNKIKTKRCCDIYLRPFAISVILKIIAYTWAMCGQPFGVRKLVQEQQHNNILPYTFFEKSYTYPDMTS